MENTPASCSATTLGIAPKVARQVASVIRFLRARAIYLILLAVLAGAFALRVYCLNAQSLWNDEGTSVALAQLSLPAIANGAAHDIHPPLYYVLLHFWMSVAGDGEFAVRFLSALAGVLLIAVTYRVARNLFMLRDAVIAALLSVLSAFQIYYAQETRMYIFLALWSALSILTLVQWRNEKNANRIWHFLLYLVLTIAVLYTHYFAFTLILFENLVFVVWLAFARRARTLVFWMAAQIVIVLAFVPWLAFAGNQLASWPAISEQLSPLELTTRVLSAFVLGIDAPLGNQVFIVGAYAIFFLGGLFRFRQNAWGNLVIALWAVVPFVAMYVVSLQRPAYNPKFLLLATPGFFILVARGVTALSTVSLFHHVPLRVAQFFIVISAVIVGAVLAVRGVYADPRLQRDDYRDVIRYINAIASADDVVLVDAPGQIDVFNYYYRGAAKVQTLPLGRPMQKEATRAVLEDLTTRYRNLYAVYWATQQADPENFIGQYLSVHAYQAADEWHGNIRLAQYALSRAVTTTVWQSSSAQFGNEIQLTQFSLGAPTLPRGQILPIHLQWRAVQKPATDYKVFIHLLDAQNKIVSQRDTEPVSGFHPTTMWNAGEMIDDRLGVMISPDARIGDYTVEMGLYRAEGGTRLLLASGGDYLILGRVRITE